ncbi:MAG: methyltransferase domain-containing protein [Planctomycetota bacterium]
MTSSFDRHYYETYYRNYTLQNPRRKLLYYRRILEKHLGEGAPRSVHDMGCAFGAFLGSLDDTWEIHGSDVSEFAIEEARKSYPRGAFLVGDASRAPVFSRPFGVVTAFDVIEHVPDLDRVADSVNAQLVFGGLFVFVVPVYDGLSGPIIRLLDRDPTHVHKWPRQRWLDWAVKSFELLEWQGIVRYLLPWGYYLHVVTNRCRAHAPAILVACRKRS